MKKSIGDFVGVPYADRGRTLDGADCWGLVCLVYAGCLGIALPTYEDLYQPIADRDALDLANLINEKRSLFVPLALRPDMFDLVLLNIGGVPCHVGICTGDDRMLHVQRGFESWVEPLNRPRWKNRIAGYYRYAG